MTFDPLSDMKKFLRGLSLGEPHTSDDFFDQLPMDIGKAMLGSIFTLGHAGAERSRYRFCDRFGQWFGPLTL